MTQHKVQPTVEENAPPMGGTTYRHDAYSTIRLTNPQGGSSTLFGSDIRHDNKVCIEICRAKLERSLGRDWILPEKTILSLEMSHAQFAQFITSSGKYEGTPCTLLEAPLPGTETRMMPGIANIETKHAVLKREIREEARDSLSSMQTLVSDLQSLVGGGKPRISELKNIASMLANAIGNLPSNMEFVVGSAEEALEKATSDAKIEVEAYIAATAQRIGLNHISQLGQIENKEKSNDDGRKQTHGADHENDGRSQGVGSGR